MTAAAVEPEAVVPAGPEATAARAVVLDAVWDGSARRPRYGREDPLRRLADPEQVLSAYPWWFSGQTLRERADGPDQLRSLRDRLTDKLEYAERDAVRARLLSVRAVVSRVLGDLDVALADGRAALEHAEATGELRPVSIVQARLAHVLQWRGEYAEADRLYAQADSVELPGRLRAEITELAGRSAYEQGRFLEAVNHFEAALDLRRNGDPELVARIEQALDAVSARARDKGWGPYPRTTDEILQRPTPQPPDGNAFAEIQPFGEYAAWVRRPDSAVWELVDGRGELLIDGAAGYRAARPFSDGLAWVSRDETGGWFAIDHQNQVVVPGGFDDVGPFRRGVAPIRRGDGWGAIDRYGLIVIQPEYRGFATVLVGGRRPEGFTDEGLAIVDAGDGLGVVDRTGRLLVAPVHARLVIHPVAYLIGDRSGRWGALDRHGDPLVDVVHAAEEDVADEVERLFGDARPVL